jgi:hypothetical protein
MHYLDKKIGYWLHNTLYAVILTEYSTDIDMHDMYSLAFFCFIGKENSLQKVNKLNEEFKEKRIEYGMESAIIGFHCRLFTK